MLFFITILSMIHNTGKSSMQILGFIAMYVSLRSNILNVEFLVGCSCETSGIVNSPVNGCDHPST